MPKKLLSIFLLFTAHFTIAQTPYPGNIAGCVARYSFSPSGLSNILVDVSGNNNSGITHNLTATAGWSGAANAAMKFDGSSSYALVLDAPNLSPQQITTVALVKFDGFYSGKCQYSNLLCKGYPAFTPGVYAMGITDQIYDNNCATHDPAHMMRSDYLGPNNFITPQSAVIQTDKWYFMATTYDGNTWQAYQVDMDSANLLTSIAPMFTVNNINSQIGANTQDLAIGRSLNPSYPYWLNGALDEEAIFNRSQEIYNIYYFLFKGFALGANDAEAKHNEIEAGIRNGKLHLAAPDGGKIGEVALYNLQGQAVSARTLTSMVADLDVSSFPKGLLFIKIARNSGVSTLKVSNL